MSDATAPQTSAIAPTPPSAPRPPSFCLCRQCWHFSRLSPKASARKRVLIAPPAGWNAAQPHALSRTTRTGSGQNNVNTPQCGERKLNWGLRQESVGPHNKEKSCNAAVTQHWDASKRKTCDMFQTCKNVEQIVLQEAETLWFWTKYQNKIRACENKKAR